MICDFCSSVEVVGVYPAKDFSIDEMMWGSEGGFAVCERCRRLIEAGNPEALLNRAVTTFMALYGVPYIPDELKEMLRNMHQKFFELRTGEYHAIG